MEKLEKTPFGVGIPGTVKISGSFLMFDKVVMDIDMYAKTETIQACIDQFNELPGSVVDAPAKLTTLRRFILTTLRRWSLTTSSL